jgi:hypothetical protein
MKLIYFLSVSDNSILKTVKETDHTTEKYSNGDYSSLYGLYELDSHAVYKGDLPTYYTCASGELVELSQYEAYLDGQYTLADGEYISDGVIATAVNPNSTYYAWDAETGAYTISDDNVTAWQEALVETVSSKRDEKLAEGTTFEDLYTVKGRTQDLADATACYNMVANGSEVTWFYSSGESETISATDRMQEIYSAIGVFRSAQFTRESEVKVIIRALDGDGLQSFDLDEIW